MVFFAIVSLSHEYKMERLLCFSLKCAKIELENELQLKVVIDCVHPSVLKKEKNKDIEAGKCVQHGLSVLQRKTEVKY